MDACYFGCDDFDRLPEQRKVRIGLIASDLSENPVNTNLVPASKLRVSRLTKVELSDER